MKLTRLTLTDPEILRFFFYTWTALPRVLAQTPVTRNEENIFHRWRCCGFLLAAVAHAADPAAALVASEAAEFTDLLCGWDDCGGPLAGALP